MRLTKEQAKRLTELRKKSTADGADKDFMWDTYHLVYAGEPSGQKDCGYCVREVFEKLIEALDEDRAHPDFTLED